MRQGDAGAAREFGSAALIITLLTVLCAAVYHTALWEPLITEDCQWIQGSNFGFSNRNLQVLLLHDLLPRLSGPHVEGFYCLSIGLHLLSSVLIYLLFLTLARTRGSGFPGGSLTHHLGGAMAALLFLVYNSVPIGFLSALSYQLVTASSLLTLLLARIYLRTGQPLLWLMVLGSFGVALASHTYGLCLVGLLLGLELLWSRAREPGEGRGGWGGILLRHGPVLAMAGWYLVHYWDLFGRGLTRLEGTTSLKLHEEPLRFALYLQVATMDLAQNLAPLGDKVRRYGMDHGGQPLGGHLLLILAVVVAASLLAGRQLMRRRQHDAAGVFLIFVLLWNLLAFVLTRPVPTWDHHLWRFSFNAASLCLFAPYALLCAADRGAARLGPRWRALPASLLILLAMIMWGPDLGRRTLGLWDRAASGRWGRNPGSCRLPAQCDAWATVAAGEVARAGRGARSLACADLSNLQLEGVDLREADLRGANLSNARLKRVNLGGARLDGACLNWARLEEVNAQGARLRGASFVGATLLKSDLTGADTRDVNRHCLQGHQHLAPRR